MVKPRFSILAALLMISCHLYAAVPAPFIINSGNSSTLVRVLDDDLLQISFRHDSTSGAGNSSVNTTEMVFKKDYAGPQSYQLIGSGFQTNDLQVTVANNCLTIVETR